MKHKINLLQTESGYSIIRWHDTYYKIDGVYVTPLGISLTAGKQKFLYKCSKEKAFHLVNTLNNLWRNNTTVNWDNYEE